MKSFALKVKTQLNSIGSKQQKQARKIAIASTTLCSIFFLSPYPGNTEESQNNSLPSPPDTGSPEEDFAAGGTRKNHQFNKICGVAGQEIIYLLGNNNREFTASAYPTFWFYIPDNLEQVKQIKFVLKELETGNKIYNRPIEIPEKLGIIGIKIPPEPQYALTPNINYHWSLEIDCIEPNYKPVIALSGWLRRLPSNLDLQNQLAITPSEDKYQVYLQHDLLYDGLDYLAKLYIAEPHNPRLKTSWNQLLVKMGWQDLAQECTIEPYIAKAARNKENPDDK